MKKILYVTTFSGTINKFLIPHIEMLIKKGYKVDCACGMENPIDKRLLARGVKIYEVPFTKKYLSIDNFRAYRKLLEIQRINQYDIIHVHTHIAAMYGRFIKRTFPKIKTIYTVNGYKFFKGGSKLLWLIYYPIEKIMAKYTDITININREDYEITKNKLKPRKCYLVSGLGLDIESYKKLSEEERSDVRLELGLEKEDFIVIMIAELNKNKNQIQLIKALELLKGDYPRIKAINIGEGDKLQELKEEANKRGIEKNILFLSHREDMNNIINISDIGIVMSYSEGLPRNIIELMANGRKIIATNIRGCKDIVWNENVGTLVNIGDYKETAKIIKDYFLENNKIFKVPDEIRDYEMKNILEKLNNIYDEIEWNDSNEITRKYVEINSGI